MSQRFHFIRSGRIPVVCVAVNLDRDSNVISYGLSVRNFESRNYSKRLEREIATGRLNKHPVQIKTDIPKSGHEITKMVMEDIASRNNIFVQHDHKKVVSTSGIPDNIRAVVSAWIERAKLPREQVV